MSELMDGYSAMKALAFVSIYEHPALAKLLFTVQITAANAGLD